MLRKKGLPRIDRGDIETALDEMVGYSARSRPDNPLHHLLIVDIFLSDPTMPKADGARSYALATLLTQHIEREFFALRRKRNLDIPPSAYAQPDNYDYHQSILLDVTEVNLRAWSLLYYCYVRVDLAITPKVYGDIIGTVERNLNRYRIHAISKLLKLLIELEHQARLSERKMRIRSALPAQSARLLGRDALLENLCQTAEHNEAKHFYINGVNGIGKTSFINALASKFIEGNLIDELVWIDAPYSVTYIEQYVTEQLISEGVQTSLRGLMMRDDYRTLIVCDGIDNLLLTEKSALESLLNQWDSAFIFLTSQTYDTIQFVDTTLTLGELDTHSAELFVQRLLNSMHAQDLEAIEIVRDIGGNPRSLQAAVTRLDIESWGGVRQTVKYDLFANIFDNFDERLRIAWCICSLYAHGMPSSQLKACWSNLIDVNVLRQMRRFFVIEVLSSEDVYHLSQAASQFIAAAYALRDDVKLIFSQLLHHIDKQVHKNPENILFTSQNLLTHNWITLSSTQRREWVEMLWSYGISHGYAALWRIILENSPKSFEIHLAYSLCLRRLGEWDKAERELDILIRNSGSSNPPNFEFQAKALYERGVVFRYGGQYERASMLIQRAEATALRLQNVRLLESIQLEKAHVAIERKLYAESNFLLGGLPMSARVSLLLSEAALGEDDIMACRSFIEQGLNLAQNDIGLKAAFYNVLGRSYDKEGDYETARNCFISSIVLLEQIHDVVGLARTRGNLGVALMHIGEYQPAHHLFTQSKQELTQLGDIIGVTTVQHNQHILRGLQR